MDRSQKLVHTSLRATLIGTEEAFHDTRVVHYRGIQYAKIHRRFAQAELVDDWHEEKLDCTRFGPQCPQNHVDVGHLLRIPEVLDEGQEEIAQDELKCLNLNVSIPVVKDAVKELLPVLVWIHGGSQVVSFPPAGHRCSNANPLISQSLSEGKPIIVVTFNYRLNIFGFGDGTVKNLAIKDQRLAIEWVFEHIAGFGGDKDNITLAGESAGAIYTHAHLAAGSPVRRGILQSGTLYLSPPQPVERGNLLISTLSTKIEEQHHVSLNDAPVSAILQQLTDSNINTLYIQQEPDLQGWEDRTTKLPELLIGDVEYESVIWRNGLEAVSADEIAAAFDSDTEFGTKLKHIYGISPTRPSSSKNGALDFVTDTRFALPVEDMSRARRAAGKTAYQYVFDQPNPWQSSSRAHHAVDLVFLFGGYDLSPNPAADKVGYQMRDKWIRFINGERPWDGEKRFAFGPHGKCGEIDDEEYAARRRASHFELLRDMGSAITGLIVAKLTAGRISLLN